MISWLLDDMPYNPFLSLCFQICYCLFLNTHEQAQNQLISVISPCQKWLSFPQAVVRDGCADVWGWKRWQSQPGPVGGGDSCYCPQLETEVSPAAESSAGSAEASRNSQHMNMLFEGVHEQTTSNAFIQLTCCPWEDWISWATAAKASEFWSWGGAAAAAAEFAVDTGWASWSLTGDCGDAAETHQ